MPMMLPSIKIFGRGEQTVDRGSFLSLSKFAASVQLIAFCLTIFFVSDYICEEACCQMAVIKLRYRSHLTDEHLTYPHLCLSSYEPSFSKLSQLTQCHLRSRKVNEKHLLIMVNYFCLKNRFSIKIKHLYFCTFDVRMLCYICLPS